MIEHRKTYRDPFHLRSSIFVFFSHPPNLPHPHTSTMLPDLVLLITALAHIPSILTARKPDDETAASIRTFAGGGDASAVGLHDGADDGETQPTPRLDVHGKRRSSVKAIKEPPGDVRSRRALAVPSRVLRDEGILVPDCVSVNGGALAYGLDERTAAPYFFAEASPFPGTFPFFL